MAEFPPIGETTYPVTRAVTGPVTAGGGSPTVPITALYLPGSSGNVATSPDSAALSITGDIDIRCLMRSPNWPPTGGPSHDIMHKLTGDYYFWHGSGNFVFEWHDGTSGHQLIADGNGAVDFPDNSLKWARVTLDVDDGGGGHVATFYVSDDGSNWSQYGTTKSAGAFTTQIRDGTGPLQIGRNAPGVVGVHVHRAILLNGIDGTPAFDMDFTDETPGATSVTEDANGATVTINQSGGPVAEIIEV